MDKVGDFSPSYPRFFPLDFSLFIACIALAPACDPRSLWSMLNGVFHLSLFERICIE